MKAKYRKKKNDFVAIAKQRIAVLFSEAKKMYSFDPKLSNRYVALARKIGMKYKVPISKPLQRQFCKHCYVYLMPGDNCRVRTARGKVVYYCLKCKKYMRFVYST